MSQRNLFLVVTASVLFATAASASPGANVPPFGPGEQLTLELKYLGMKAGTAQITVGAPKEGDPYVWPIVGNLRTETLLAWYPVKDKLITYWDASRASCSGSEMYADENHNRHRMKIDFDHASRTAVVLKQKEGQPLSRSVATVDVGAMDYFAATFALRDKPLAQGDRYVLPIFTGSKNQQIEAFVDGLQTVETPLGKKPAIRVRVRTGLDGKFRSNRDLFVYFTQDAHHVPVRLEADFAFGNIVAEATDYKPGHSVVLPAVADTRP